MNYDELVRKLLPQTLRFVTALHETALRQGCTLRIDEEEGKVILVYSVRRFSVSIDGDSVTLSGEFDLRAFLRLYRETSSRAVRELMFTAATACTYCITDKCTTFLMARQRTVKFDGKEKKLCGPYRHWISISVTESSLSACVDIAEMMFEYTYPHMHIDLFRNNKVTYTVSDLGEFFVVGYMARHSALSNDDRKLVEAVLEKRADGKRRVDSLIEAVGQVDTGICIGAIDKFANGNDYEFIFGIITDKKPESLPEGGVCRKIKSGEWAVYDSSVIEYQSIWKHFSDKFFGIEGKGYDTSRIPFEHYDENGNLYDVHIPVDSDMPADSAKTVTMHYIPTLRVAGFPMMGETDHPLYPAAHWHLSQPLAASRDWNQSMPKETTDAKPQHRE